MTHLRESNYYVVVNGPSCADAENNANILGRNLVAVSDEEKKFLAWD